LKGKFESQVLVNQMKLDLIYKQDMSTLILLEIDGSDIKYTVTE